MSSDNYNEFINKLTKDNKEYLEDIKEKKYKIHKVRIKEGIETDKNHLMLVNLCANLFQYGTYFNEKYGYRVVLIEPFIEEGDKNFDLAIFNKNTNTLILVECKYSLSNISKKLNDIEKAIKSSNEKIKKYENILGNKIDNIEYVLCTDSNDSIEVADKILEKNMPLITWGCSLSKSELKLFIMKGKEEHGSAYISHRVHSNEDFNKDLYEGAKSLGGTTNLFKFLPSINTAIILTEINMTIKEMIEKDEIKKNEIDFINIYHILEKELNYSTLNESDIEKIALRIIEKAKIKEIYELSDAISDDNNVKKQKLNIKISITSGKKVKEKTEENYIELNAARRAEKEAIEEIESSGRIPDLYRFFTREKKEN